MNNIDTEIKVRSEARNSLYVLAEKKGISEKEESELIDLVINESLTEIKQVREDKRRAKYVKDKMLPSWGVWKSGGGESSSPTERACSIAEGLEIYGEGSECSTLCDYLSAMYSVDEAVSKLNRHEADLIKGEFIPDFVEQESNHLYDYSERITHWCVDYGMTASNYRKVKQRAIQKVVEFMADLDIKSNKSSVSEAV